MPAQRIRVWVQQFKDRANLVLQWIDPDTHKRKSQSAGTNDPEQAETKRADLEADLNAGRHRDTSRMSWARFRELFEEEYASGLRPDTRDNYSDTFLCFERLCNPTSLRSINERTISRFVGALRQQPGYGGPLKASTIKIRLQFLRTALNWAASQKLIAVCPSFPDVKVPRKKPQPVPVESFERMLDKAPDAQMRAFLLCGWLAGLRLNEARQLEWEETSEAPFLDLAGQRIVFPAEFVKADEDQWVPLDPQLRQALLELPQDGRRVFRFVDRAGKRVGLVAVSHRVSEIARQARVRLTMKSLRRGFGCRYASKVPAQVLQKLMRHSSIKVTMDYYANVDDAAMQAVLGLECNTLRNRQPHPAPDLARMNDATQDVATESE